MRREEFDVNKCVLKKIAIFFIISIIVELAVFNRAAFFSMSHAENVKLDYQASEQFVVNESGQLELSSGQSGYFSLAGMTGELGYMLFDIDCVNSKGETVPYKLQISVSDEGNAQMYSLPAVTVYSDVQETKYINAHSYGDVETMRIYLSADSNVKFSVHEILYNVQVPVNFSVARMLLVFAGIGILWCIRPGSALYTKHWSRAEKVSLIMIVFAANLLLWHWLIHLNPTFMEPTWEHHKQYHKLAVAITEGEVSIPVGIEEEMSALENPYDYGVRRKEVTNAYSGWDTAFYEGKFYVYFGVVPVLLFYLPYYVLTGNAFQTWWGIFLAGAAILAGMFYLLKQVSKKYFPNSPFLLQVILAVIAGNCMSTIMFMMRPDFYSLPLMCAMAFSVWGLGLWISASYTWKKELEGENVFGRATVIKLASGSLCMALVAGSRPQFLMGSFLIFFIFADCVKAEWKENRKELLYKAVAAAVPFIIVAVGLMVYNYVRFGSPIDFGANYNLTTNDMTHRGFNLGRIADGIFMYLLQFPNIGASYPYVYSVSFNSSYVGKTIREAMFGGVFFTNTILFALLALKKIKDELKEKKLFGMIVTSVIFAVMIAVADAQLAGILSRYYADFLWLLMFAACMVILQLWESFEGKRTQKSLVLFVIVCGIWGILMQFGMGIQTGDLASKNTAAYYAIKEFWF